MVPENLNEKRRVKKYMKISRSKTTATIASLFLMFAMVFSMVFVPATNAQTSSEIIYPFAYIAALPTTVGVSQYAVIYMWLDQVFDGAALVNDYRFHNYKLTITKPDNTVETHNFDYISDPTSNQGFSYAPDMAGEYILNFTFPGQAITDYGHNPSSSRVNWTYAPASAQTTLTVQEEAVPYPPVYPLPTEYWTRPIYGENPNWFTVSSNWLGQGAAGYGGYSTSYNAGGNGEFLNPSYNIGPLTSHIMWTKSIQSGGVVGGDAYTIPGNTYFEGSAYNQRYGNPIIVNGKLYYTTPNSFLSDSSFVFGSGYVKNGPEYCVDLRTGEQLWARSDVPPLSFALIWDHEDPNQHGVYPAILCTSNFGQCFDADTGNPLFNATGVPSDSGGYARCAGPNDEQLRYTIVNMGNNTNPDWTLCLWNSTKMWSFSGLIPTISGTVSANQGNRYEYLDPQTQNVSISYINSIPKTYNSRGQLNTPFTLVRALYNDILLCYNGTLPSEGANQFVGSYSTTPYNYFAINLNASRPGYKIGDLLWSETLNPPTDHNTVIEAGVDPVNRVFVENYRSTAQFVGYSLDDGSKLWGPTPPQAALDYYGSQASGTLSNAFAYGKMYSAAFAGIVYCYDTKTGDLLWTYGNGGEGNSTDSGFAAPGNYPTQINAIGNGVVYTVTSEHTVETPVYKGALARAINATDGTEIWTISSYTTEFFTMSYAIADGYATWYNSYDNSIYVVGRGPSATTVTIQNDISTLGDKVLVKGSVIDIAAGTQQNEQAADFPNGVPVASDAGMKDWMGYVYQQKPRPTDFTGVNVDVSVLDPNGNCYSVGNATTDENGLYSVAFTPLVPGKYTVYATFAGTNSYWPSQAATAINVDPAPVATAQPTPVPQEPVGTYFTVSTVAIIVAIAIVAIILLRKR
jgi:hypothetical protein